MDLNINLLKAVFVAILALMSSVSALGGESGTQYFRHEIVTKSGDFTYAGKISIPAPTTGTIYKVETDERGHVAQVTEVHDGKSSLVRRYQFSGSEKLASGYDQSTTNPERSETVRIERTPTGDRKRTDRMNAKGDLTSYTTYADASDHVDVTTFSADGKQTGHRAYYFSGAGNCVRRITYLSNAELDSDIDEATGQEKTTKQIDVESGQTATQKFTYGPDGDVVELDVFNSSGDRFATQEYAGGLVTKRFYNYSDGTTKDIRYTYDSKGSLTTSEVFFNSKLICRLTYERLADGTIKRTLALGPDGELWAEYPAPEVVDIQDSGQPVNRTDGVIHRSGLWWGYSAQQLN